MAEEEPVSLTGDTVRGETDNTSPQTHSHPHQHSHRRSTKKSPQLSPLGASFFLFLAATFILGYLVFILLNVNQRLPPHLTDVATQIFGGGGLLTIVVTIYSLVTKGFANSVWQAAYRFYSVPLSILLSILIVAVLTVSDLLLIPAQPMPMPTPYPPYIGVHKLTDQLQTNSKGYGWFDGSPNGDDNKDFCHFRNGGYLVSVSVKLWQVVCGANNTRFDNFVYEASMKVVQGDGGGIIFRGDINDSGVGPYYYFKIYVSGYFWLWRFDEKGGKPISAFQKSRFIKTGLGQTNIIAVAANGGKFDLYINHNPVGQAQDGQPYPYEQIGVAAFDETSSTQVLFTNANVWQL